MKPRVAILFDNFGPYHLARLRAASQVCELLAVEFGSSSNEYAWDRSAAEGIRKVTLNPSGASSELTRSRFSEVLGSELGRFRPDVVFVPGWGSRRALLSLWWCIDKGVPAVVMSESTAWDEKRSPLKEWMKGRILSLFIGGLVGGSPHREYLQSLGMSSDHIIEGYDVVDNGFFETAPGVDASGEMNKFPREKYPHPSNFRPFFLASARFVPKKNLPFLIRAYADYRRTVMSSGNIPWNLVILGDGPLRGELETLGKSFELGDALLMPGFVQYPDLPRWYHHAACFVHTSTTEQWGLVVNEAMASGLPLLVSNRCGCSRDLLVEGVNGWTFDPTDFRQLSMFMERMASESEMRERMGRESRALISSWSPQRFASAVSSAVKMALSAPPPSSRHKDRLLLRLAILR